jgi:hypothetical protein
MNTHQLMIQQQVFILHTMEVNFSRDVCLILSFAFHRESLTNLLATVVNGTYEKCFGGRRKFVSFTTIFLQQKNISGLEEIFTYLCLRRKGSIKKLLF